MFTHITDCRFFVCNLFFVILFIHTACDNRRPIYIIGHMTNSIEDVIPYLDSGANVLESDVQFHSNGTLQYLYHGCPGDCFRICNKHVQVPEYLRYLRNITEPSARNSYSKKLVMQFFDLKMDSVNNKEKAGRQIAGHIIDYLWSSRARQQEVRVLIYINDAANDKDAFSGFLKEFQDRGMQSRLKDVGFDGGMMNISDIQDLIRRLKISNTWQGDGNINCFSAFRSDDRLKREIKIRDSGGYINKIYDWTVDGKNEMRKSLNLGVDGFITNRPSNLVEVLEEDGFKKKFRAATTFDPPFATFKG